MHAVMEDIPVRDGSLVITNVNCQDRQILYEQKELSNEACDMNIALVVLKSLFTSVNLRAMSLGV